MSPILGIIASANQQGRGGGPESGYDSLATITVPSGGVASVTFAGIPTGYKHLQIRAISQTNRTIYNTSALKLTINGDTGSNYSSHILSSDPASPSTAAVAGAGVSQTSIAEMSTSSSVASNVFGSTIVDVLDYASSNKNKTIRFLSGADTNGAASGFASWIGLGSGAWLNTSAVTSITFVPQFGTLINEYSSFALYGIK
jgi:hypothetical protein